MKFPSETSIQARRRSETPIQAQREERRSKHGERNSDPSTTRRAPIQAHRSTTSADLKLRSKHGEKNADPSTTRRTPIQARREELRSKHGERNSDPSTTRRAPIRHKRQSTPLCLCWCVRVWVYLVLWCLWVILWLIFDFCGWFLIVCGSVCIRGSGVGCADGEEREKKERN